MCGIAGLVTTREEDAAPQLYDILTMIQHRGQDAAGIATCDRASNLHMRKDNGLVRDVFHTRHMKELTGNMGIAHCRYPTAGSASNYEAQPFYVNSPYGIVLAHNGNLTNTRMLSEELFEKDLRHLNTNSDSEVLLNIFAHELSELGKLRFSIDPVFDAVARVHRRVDGAYAVVAMILGQGILAFRDPYGIRPLVIGVRESLSGKEYMVSSESVAFQAMGFDMLRDVEPGEAIFITHDGQLHSRIFDGYTQKSPCIFEYVYLARPDSLIDGVSVYKSRLRQGEYLAKKILREFPKHDIDVVIPIPESSRTCAVPIAHLLGVKYREGFIKNRYIGRTFIMPGQKERKKSIRQKLNAINLEFEGKTVLLVDDSIVRGNTSEQIVQMARDAGAKKVYFASAAPPVRYPNVYGIDMPIAEELIGHGKTEEEIGEAIGADWIIFQDLEDLQRSVIDGNPDIKDCEKSCFNGEYITNGITQSYLKEIGSIRNDAAKEEENKEHV